LLNRDFASKIVATHCWFEGIRFLDQGAGVGNRPVVVSLPHLRPALLDLFNDEGMRKVTGFWFHIDENLPACLVDHIVGPG
jgi:hypothetical protein